MPEFDDILVSGEFSAFREAYAPAVQPAGPTEVRRTVRRRRQRVAVLTAAVAVLAVTIPVAANTTRDRGSAPPPGPAQTGEPSPSSTVPPTPTPSSVSPTAAAPDGRISRSQLLAARVDLPAWPEYLHSPPSCGTEDVRLRPGPNVDSVPALLGDPGHGDLDGDGAVETVALLGCRANGETLGKQVVAFDRDAAGRIVTMGRVVGAAEGMDDIADFSVQDDGKVRVHVADVQPCCGLPSWWPQGQWRTYAWTGDRFDQTAGPTKFGVDPRLTDLTLTAGELALGPPDGQGRRTGTVTVTVVNRGPVDVPRLGFDTLTSIGEPDGADLDRCRTADAGPVAACLLDPLPAGGRKTYTFRFLVDPPGDDDLRPVVQVVHFDAQDRYWDDLKRSDNRVELRTAG
ncbi:hypothetical protein D7147_21995 [Micromonospora musae]|uniref:DUF11 domain-containing protein n=1 Tax=Micromonospora musae TaxID=1894970 RepID=A0ABX9R2J2_9ACTN|nr:hypothetical protein [Micromonospora musae]RKN17306.1 hypothetical protein D7147_21995 [Micromonospora musae]